MSSICGNQSVANLSIPNQLNSQTGECAFQFFYLRSGSLVDNMTASIAYLLESKFKINNLAQFPEIASIKVLLRNL